MAVSFIKIVIDAPLYPLFKAKTIIKRSFFMGFMIDVVIPKDNEERLAVMARKLGFMSLCLIYDRIDPVKTDGIRKICKKAGIDPYFGSFGNPNADIVFSDISRDDINDAVQNRRTDVLCGFENLRAKDRLKQRSSGLDPVLCKMMSDKKKMYCIDFGSILAMNKDARATAIARLKQNMMLCRKFRIEIAVASFASYHLKMRNPMDVLGFLAALGCDNGKRPFEAIEGRIIFNNKKREGKIIREGVEVD